MDAAFLAGLRSIPIRWRKTDDIAVWCGPISGEGADWVTDGKSMYLRSASDPARLAKLEAVATSDGRSVTDADCLRALASHVKRGYTACVWAGSCDDDTGIPLAVIGEPPHGVVSSLRLRIAHLVLDFDSAEYSTDACLDSSPILFRRDGEIVGLQMPVRMLSLVSEDRADTLWRAASTDSEAA